MPDSPRDFKPGSRPGTSILQDGNAAERMADYPSPEFSTSEPSLINPGPKLAMILLVIALMAGYVWQFHGFNPSASMGQLNITTPPAGSMGQPSPPATGENVVGQNQPGQPPAVQGGEPLMRPDDAEAKAQQERLARFNKTPRLMTGQNFGNEDLSGLSISNSSISKAVFSGCFALNAGIHKILFKDCTFTDTDFTRANIREVIFENCSFENTRFDESVFFNVSFINCSFKGNQRENGLSKARIALSRLYNVTFENATLENFLLFQDSGRTYFKSTDLTGLSIRANGSNAFYPRLDVSPVQFDLRLENCTGGDFELDVNNVPSELRINKASFDNAKINYFTRIQITDSSIGGLGYIEAKEWLVVKNSTLCADLGAYGGMYLIGNTYVSERSASKVNAFLDAPEGMYRTTKLRPKNGSLCVVEGGAPGAWLTVFGGNLYISGLEMDLAFFDVDNNTREKIALNLKDVSIRSGHLYSMPDETYWENVNIRETMTARQTRDRNPKEIQAVNVTMPEGKPWLDGDAFIIIPAEKKDWVKYEVPFMRFQGNH